MLIKVAHDLAEAKTSTLAILSSRRMTYRGVPFSYTHAKVLHKTINQESGNGCSYCYNVSGHDRWTIECKSAPTCILTGNVRWLIILLYNGSGCVGTIGVS